jgi:hypothetical protein
MGNTWKGISEEKLDAAELALLTISGVPED